MNKLPRPKNHLVPTDRRFRDNEELVAAFELELKLRGVAFEWRIDPEHPEKGPYLHVLKQ